MAPSIEEQLAPYLTTGTVIVFPIATFSLMFSIFGIYIVIFGLSLHVLLRRRHTSARRLYLWCTIILFALDITHVIFHSMATSRQAIVDFEAAKTKDWPPFLQYLSKDTRKTAFAAGSDLTSFLMNVIADCMLIHRCYVIWDSQKLILYPLIIGSVIVNGVLLGSDIPRLVGVSNNKELFQKANNVNRGAFLAVAALNMLITLLTAGRISWVTHGMKRLMRRPINSQYKRIVSVIVESGMIYSVALFISVIVPLTLDSGSHGFIPVDLSVLSTQLSGLAPTLIIVRAAHNKSMEITNPAMSTLNFADTEPAQSVARTTGELYPSSSGPDSGTSASSAEKV